MAALDLAAWIGLAWLAVAVLLADDPPVTPPMLLRAFVLFVALPAGVAVLIAREFAAEVRLHGPDLIIAGRRRRLEVPLASIERVRAWRLPLPLPGFSIELRSGRWLGWAIGSRDPMPILRELERAGVPGAAEACSGCLARWTASRAAFAQPGPTRLFLKFPGFALLPTALLFNVHQQIAYGGFRGEYYLLGLQSYLATFATYWAATTVYLLIFAAFLRAFAEVSCLGVTCAAPSRAERARRRAELACRVGYYAGVPLVLLLRFLP